MICKEIEMYISHLAVEGVSDNRKVVLQPLITYIQNQINKNEDIRLQFICTHNSRRSHLAQIWAQTMAYYFKVQNVVCYSGGTEVTALFPMVANTLQNIGFEMQKISEGNNPIYSFKYAENEQPIIGFSKKIDNHSNPKSGFCAVMTCSQADEDCPFVLGAENRIPITYEDPKVFDKTSQQKEEYEERSRQIATEMKYIFSQIRVK